MNIHLAMNKTVLSSATGAALGNMLGVAVAGSTNVRSRSSAAAAAGDCEFRWPGLELSQEQFGRRRTESLLPTGGSSGRCRVSRLRDSSPVCARDAGQLNFLKKSDFGDPRQARVFCIVGVTPLEESEPEAAGPSGLNHVHEVPGSSDRPHLLSGVPEHVVSQVGGKAGSIAFYARPTGPAAVVEEGGEVEPKSLSQKLLTLVWLLGPFILVASVVLPPLYLRKIFGAVLEDSLVTDFVILFFTETLFFVGASVFLYIAHVSRQSTATTAVAIPVVKPVSPVYSLGYRISARVALAAGVLLPAATFVIVWPWTGPAAAAALAPYMIGVLVQLGFEQIILANNSPVWPLVPVTFQFATFENFFAIGVRPEMYRLHQLNRAAQLVAGLLFSLKGVEATAETMAINSSLQTLLFVLQVLGMLCLWSLGSFLTNHLPTQLDQQCTPSLP